MPIKSKTDLAALSALTDSDRADLSALFDGLEERNTQISDLRQRQTAADATVKKAGELEKLLKEKETLSSELQAKLDKLTIKSPAPVADSTFDDLLPFAELRRSLEELLGNDPEGAE